jgi:hypothetical protein
VASVAAERTGEGGGVIAELRVAGATSLRALATGLNERGIEQPWPRASLMGFGPLVTRLGLQYPRGRFGTRR